MADNKEPKKRQKPDIAVVGIIVPRELENSGHGDPWFESVVSRVQGQFFYPFSESTHAYLLNVNKAAYYTKPGDKD